MPRGPWGADRWIDYSLHARHVQLADDQCEGPPGRGCPGTFIEQADRRHRRRTACEQQPRSIPNLKPMHTQEFTLGIDHELSRTMSVGVRYAHKWLDRTIEDVGVQVAGVGEVFMIANPGYGIAEYTLAATCPTCPAQPKAKRVYDGLGVPAAQAALQPLVDEHELRLSAASTATTPGWPAPTKTAATPRASTRFFDGLYMSFDAPGNPIYGRSRPIVRTTSSSRAPTTCLGAPGSAPSSRPPAARRSRARSLSRACRCSTTAAATSAARRRSRRRACRSITTSSWEARSG